MLSPGKERIWTRIIRGGVLARIEASEKKLNAVKAQREKDLKAAKDAVKQAQANHDLKVEQAKQAAESAWEPYKGLVKELGPIKLYGDRVIVSGQGTVALDESVETEIAASAASRLLSGVKKSGTGAGGLFFTVTSDSEHVVAQLDISQELEAHKFAAEIKTTIKSLETRRELALAAVKEANEELVRAENDTAEIEEKQAAYDALEADTSGIEAATAEHDALLKAIDPKEVEREKEAVRKRNSRAIAKPVSIFFGVCLLFYGINSMIAVRDGAFAGTLGLLISDCLFVYSAILIRDDMAAKTK